MATEQETTKVGRRKCPSCGLELASSVTVCPRDGTQVKANFNIDPSFTNYEFLENIGEGGMGVIYKARHKHLNKVVAIKTLHSHMTNADLIKRFELEGKAASILSHPNIIAVHDFGLTQTGQPYMIMDYVHGQTLADALRQFGTVPMAQFIPIFLQVCDALAHAHKRAVLHRDVKPSNIMLVPNQKSGFDVRIMDFGIAKLLDESETGAQNLTKTGDAIGSPIYMSPEQARGTRMDHRSDLYSLGCVMYECLSNSPPFCGNTALDTMMMHIDTKPMPISQASMGQTIDPRLEQVVMRLLEKDPANRYQTMDEVREDLIALQNPDKTAVLPSVRDSQLVTAVQKARIKEKEQKQLKEKAPLFAIIGGIAVVTVICVAVLLWGSPHGDGVIKKSGKAVKASSGSGSNSSDTTDDTNTVLEKKAEAERKKLAIENAEENKETLIDSTLPDLGTAKHQLNAQVANNVSKITIRLGIGGVLTDSDLSVLKNADQATSLVLENFPITDKGLNNIKDLKNLDLLDIHGTKARDLGFLSNLKNLKFLFVYRLKLSPQAYEHIGRLTKLYELNLGFTPITDTDLPKLYNLHELHLLGLENCKNLTTLGIDKLRNALPHCLIKEDDTEKVSATPIGSAKPEDKTSIEKTASASSSLRKAKELAAAGNWNEANDTISEALRIADLQPGNSHLIAEINLLKGDCQTHFKLWKSAANFYGQGIKLLNVDDPKWPAIYDKLASCYEASEKTEENLQQAINTRSRAEEQFERNEKSLSLLNVDLDKWKKQRQTNLDMMAKDKKLMPSHTKVML
jgi:serine/threonine protein kinase